MSLSPSHRNTGIPGVLRLPLRYLLLGVLGGFAVLTGIYTYMQTLPLLIRQVEQQALAEMHTDLNHLQGVVHILLRTHNLDGARSVIAAFGSAPDHELTVVTATDGTILAATRLELLDTRWTEQPSSVDQGLITRLAAAGGTAVHLSRDGQSLSGYTEVCDAGQSETLRPTQCGFLYTRRAISGPKAVAINALYAETIQHGLGLIVVTVILSILVYIMVTRRVEALLATARRLTAGDLTARTGLMGQDELARVGYALDTMAQAIADSHQRLETTNAQLAQRLTERQQAEAALREREARLRAIVDTAVDGIITIDEQGLIEACNPATERLFGYTTAELLGQNVRLLMPPPYRDEHDASLARYLATGQRKIIGIGREVVGLRQDGTRFPMELSVSEIQLGDRRLFTGIVHDITERKYAEDALRQAHDELEQRVQERTAALLEANEEVKRFAYIVSHDLRAPLVNLKGFAGELRLAHGVITPALASALPHLPPPQAAAVRQALEQDIPEALGFIETSVTRMDSLVRAILQLSRWGQRELEFACLDMTALVQETLETLAHQIAQRQIQVTVGALPRVRADRTAMAQILGNVLANAVNYLAPGRPGTIVITAEQHPDVTAFSIRDNGRGIAPDDLPKIFEPFRRVGQQDVPGEGMGLAYVRTLVRRHGGEITCTSTPGVGTTFTFTISHHPRAEDRQE